MIERKRNFLTNKRDYFFSILLSLLHTATHSHKISSLDYSDYDWTNEFTLQTQRQQSNTISNYYAFTMLMHTIFIVFVTSNTKFMSMNL